MKPATPGFIITLTATILLALVSFSVPWFKFVFFLKASLAVEGISGYITFGVLGYCIHLDNGIVPLTCSKASVGYEVGETPPAPIIVMTINGRLIHRYRQVGGKQHRNQHSSSCRQVDHLCPCPTHRCPYPSRHLLSFRPPCPC